MASTPLYTLASQNWWEADGSQTVWNFSFAGGYIDRTHVKAWSRAPLATVPVPITVTEDMFIGDFQLNIAPAVPAGYTIAIYRDTPKTEPLVNYQDGAQVSEVSLDTTAKQAIFAAAETADLLSLSVFDSAGITQEAIETAAAAAVTPAINALRTDLAITNVANRGAGMVGFAPATPYAVGTIGRAVQDLSGTLAPLPNQSGQAGKWLTTNGTLASWATLPNAGGQPVKRLKGDFGAVGDGVTDDTAVLNAAVAALPNGAMLVLDGVFRITSTVTINKRVSLWCNGADQALVVDVGAGNVGLHYVGGAGGLNDLNIRLYVYGAANSCLNAVKLTRVDRSQIFLNTYAGSASYGVVYDGVLCNQIFHINSGNIPPPIAGTWAYSQDHVLVQTNVTHTVASNANFFTVIYEGGRHAYTQSAMPAEGYNVLMGEIENLTGRPITVGACLGFRTDHLTMEDCALAATFDGCESLWIHDTVFYAGTFTLTNCQSPLIEKFSGTLNINATNYGTVLGQGVISPTISSNNIADETAIQYGPLNNQTTRNVFAGGPGAPTMDCIYHNPFFDVYDAQDPTTGPPDGVIKNSAGVSVARDTIQVFPGNLTPYSMAVTVNGSTIDNGVSIVPRNQPWKLNEYVSVTLPIYTNSSNGGAIVYLVTGTTFHLLGVANKAGGWTVIRGSAPLTAGNNWRIHVAGWNGTAFTTGFQFYLGGVNIVRGPVPAKNLADSLGRRNLTLSSVAFPPPFAGARAYVPGTGKWYLARDTVTVADWVILN